jgi:hypothetical protein
LPRDQRVPQSGAMQTRDEWIADRVVICDGRVVPIRATARRPHWADLPASARDAIAFRLGSEVVSTSSTGIGFTPGFASRLDLDGRRVFVKAASEADDARYRWALSEAYREEIRSREPSAESRRGAAKH